MERCYIMQKAGPGLGGELFRLSISSLAALMLNKWGPVAAQRSQGNSGHYAQAFNSFSLYLGSQDCLSKKK